MIDLTPMRLPEVWKSPSRASLLRGASEAGFTVVDPASPPDGVTVVKGLWPGIRLGRSGGNSDATAGPTGEPWVDSNGWRVRLARAQRTGASVWIDAVPTGPRLSAAAYVTAFADAAAAGGRWIISLDDKLAAGIAAQESQALE